MAAELHLDPDRLREHAITAALLGERLTVGLAAELAAVWRHEPGADRDGPPPDGRPPDRDADAGRLHATAGRVARELADLAAVLAAVAVAADAAEQTAGRAVDRLVAPGPDLTGRPADRSGHRLGTAGSGPW